MAFGFSKAEYILSRQDRPADGIVKTVYFVRKGGVVVYSEDISEATRFSSAQDAKYFAKQYKCTLVKVK